MAERENRPDNVIRIPRRLPVTFVTVIFALILVYFAVQGILVLRRTAVSAYNVGAPASDNVTGSYTAVILRNEDVFTAAEAGSVNYFASEGVRMSANGLICTVDRAGDLVERLSRAEASITLSKESRESIRLAVKDAIDLYDAEMFTTSRDAGRSVRAALFSAYVNDGKELVTEMLSEANCLALYAKESGFLMLYEDGYEGLRPEDLTSGSFFGEGTERIERSSADTVRKGDFLFKIVPDNRFRLCIPLSEEEATRLGKKTRLSVRVNKDTVLTAPFSMTAGADGNTVGVLDFVKYGGNYLKDRFLSVEILDESVTGYKIPESAIVKKSFFVVGDEYITEGGGGKRKGVIVKNGSEEYFEPATVYQKLTEDETSFILGENTAYIYSDALSAGMTLIGETRTDNDAFHIRNEMALGVMTSIEGVYQINNGYCVFKPIVRLQSSIETSYVIIASDVRYGVSPYDRIVLNADEVSENEIIYE
ncbi:MAG: hypothetical protein IJM76_09090 [Lachnospiraceae bacterium]|nr:hypothetical protein [Lachnospiraceae bacterium]